VKRKIGGRTVKLRDLTNKKSTLMMGKLSISRGGSDFQPADVKGTVSDSNRAGFG